MSDPAERGAVVAEASAFGKVILLGEHAVVYGVPALVGGLGRRVRGRVAFAPRGDPGTLRWAEPYGVAPEAHHATTERAFAALVGVEPAPPAVQAELSGDLPPGQGLGFSAAAGVALAGALERLRCGRAEVDAVRARAMAWERVFHGNPSGVDVAAAMHGGLLRFDRDRGVEPLPAGDDVWLAIGLTGTASSTRAMVERVAGLRAARPGPVRAVVDEIGRVVAEGIAAARRGDGGALGRAFDRNQALLVELQVSTEAIDRLCREARQAGALGAKLTGSGGGGAVIALAGIEPAGATATTSRERAEVVAERWREHGWQALVAAIGRGRTAAAGEDQHA